MTIGSKNIRQYIPRYSVVNNTIKELCISCLFPKYSLIYLFPHNPKGSHDEIFSWKCPCILEGVTRQHHV